MKRSLLFLLLLTFLVHNSEAQNWKWKRYQFTAGAGFAQMLGDIGGYSNGENLYGLKDLSLSQQRFDFSLNMKYRLSQYFNARLGVTYAMLHSSDDKGSNEARGLESSTNLLEPAFMLEYYFIKSRSERSFIFDKGTVSFLKFLDLYAFTGAGAAFYKSKGNAELDSRGKAPDGVTPVIPAGIGTNLILTPDLNLGLEFGTRFSFSDDLDGYNSQYSSINDVYYFLNFTITYKMKTGASGLPSFR